MIKNKMWKHKNFINLQLCAGETWILNETVPSTYQGSGGYNANFVSNGTIYTYIHFDGKPNGVRYQNSADETLVYSWADNTWTDQAYRAVTFATPPTGDLLTWLQANGTKQSTPQPTLTFKHFYDAGTIGTGTVKFRHYSQQEPSSGNVIKAGTYQFIEEPNIPIGTNIDENLTATINTLIDEDVYGNQRTTTGIAVYRSNPAEMEGIVIYNEEPYYYILLPECEYDNEDGEMFFAKTDSSKLRTIVIAADQTVSNELYKWAITDGNLVKLS